MRSEYVAMLREGLAAEFPFAKRAIDELVGAARSLHVSREAPLWAAVSGFGASWAIGAAGGIVVVALRIAGLRDPAAWLSGGVVIIGYALAVAVATRAGGRRGLAWYFVVLAVRTGLQIATTLPGYLTFCERSLGLSCSLTQYAMPYVYLAVGLILGTGAVRLVRSGSPGSNAALNAGGAFSLLAGVVGLVFFFVQPQDLVAASAITFALGGGAAFITGIVLRFRSPRLGPAAFVTVLFVVTWIATAGPFVVAASQGGLTQPASLYLSNLINALALGVGWFAVDKRQRARTTAAA
jgi:hypothetical protein